MDPNNPRDDHTAKFGVWHCFRHEALGPVVQVQSLNKGVSLKSHNFCKMPVVARKEFIRLKNKFTRQKNESPDAAKHSGNKMAVDSW